MPARWAFAIWGVIYVGEVCAYGKILMGEASAAVHKSTSVGWSRWRGGQHEDALN